MIPAELASNQLPFEQLEETLRHGIGVAVRLELAGGWIGDSDLAVVKFAKRFGANFGKNREKIGDNKGLSP